jgi:hypothetical protein
VWYDAGREKLFGLSENSLPERLGAKNFVSKTTFIARIFLCQAEI